MIIISACLAGINCKYNAENNYNENAALLIAKCKAIPICPEQLGGCPTPRLPCEIFGGTGADVLNGSARVINEEGDDMTSQFIKGAAESLKIAKLAGAKKAVLKDKSPSCGHGLICDGTFSNKLIRGNGVTAELLERNGIEVISESELSEKLQPEDL